MEKHIKLSKKKKKNESLGKIIYVVIRNIVIDSEVGRSGDLLIEPSVI